MIEVASGKEPTETERVEGAAVEFCQVVTQVRNVADTNLEVVGEVARHWMSIVHGSTGIVYFCHEWNPVFREARLLEDDAMRAAVAAVNTQVLSLAPVLNSATLPDRVHAASDDESVPVDVLVKSRGGDLWVIAAAMRLGSTTAIFSVTDAGSGSVEVVDENRELPLSGGVFQDDFAADYAVHIYRIPGAG